jgi:hypothetical protein
MAEQQILELLPHAVSVGTIIPVWKWLKRRREN